MVFYYWASQTFWATGCTHTLVNNIRGRRAHLTNDFLITNDALRAVISAINTLSCCFILNIISITAIAINATPAYCTWGASRSTRNTRPRCSILAIVTVTAIAIYVTASYCARGATSSTGNAESGWNILAIIRIARIAISAAADYSTRWARTSAVHARSRTLVLTIICLARGAVYNAEVDNARRARSPTSYAKTACVTHCISIAAFGTAKHDCVIHITFCAIWATRNAGKCALIDSIICQAVRALQLGSYSASLALEPAWLALIGCRIKPIIISNTLDAGFKIVAFSTPCMTWVTFIIWWIFIKCSAFACCAINAIWTGLAICGTSCAFMSCWIKVIWVHLALQAGYGGRSWVATWCASGSTSVHVIALYAWLAKDSVARLTVEAQPGRVTIAAQIDATSAFLQRCVWVCDVI